MYGTCLKWLFPELSFSDRWSRGTKTLGTRSYVPQIKISIYVFWFTILMECNINFMNGRRGLSSQIIWGEFLSNSYHSIWSSFSMILFKKGIFNSWYQHVSGNRRCKANWRHCILLCFVAFCCTFCVMKILIFILILFKIQYCKKYTQNIETISKNYYMCIMACSVYKSSCYKIKCYKMMYDY